MNRSASLKNVIQAALSPVTELVDSRTLLMRVWPDERSRPSRRWLHEHKQAIPVIRIGRRELFCPTQVLGVVGQKFTILPRNQNGNHQQSVILPAPDALVDAVRLLELLQCELGLKRSLRWLRQQQQERRIPHVRWGRKIFFCMVQIRAFFDRQLVRTQR